MADNPFSRRVTGGERHPISELIADDPAPQPGASFWSSVDATLTQAEHGESGETVAVSNDATPTSIDEGRRKRRRLSVMSAAAAIVLLAGVAAISFGRSEPEPTSVAVAPEATSAQAATSADSMGPDGEPATDAIAEGTEGLLDEGQEAAAPEAAVAALAAEETELAAREEAERVAREERQQSYDRVWATFTPDEQAALQNHGQAASAIYSVDGALWFSLSDLYADVTQEATVISRATCFLDGLRETLTPEEFAERIDTSLASHPINPAALPVYISCTPAREIYDRRIDSFLWGHREYSQGSPHIDYDDACFAEVFGTPEEFAASLITERDPGNYGSVVACVEARDGSRPSSIGNITESPALVPPDDAAGATPIGYGRVEGLTADGSALYTTDAAPGSALSCLQDRELQFYLQPLNGEPRRSASTHRVNGESVSAFAANATNAAWVEFCEFSEALYVADIAPDGSLLNSRPLSSMNGANQVGNVVRLTIEDGIAEAFVRMPGTNLYELFTIDVESDRVLSQTSVGPASDFELSGTTVTTEERERFLILPDGSRELIPDSWKSPIADPTTGTIYFHLYSDAPGNNTIFANRSDLTTAFKALGLAENERLLSTLPDGVSWLISQSSPRDCTSTVVVRSANGQDRTVLESPFPISTLRFDSARTWNSIGWCGDAAIPTLQFGHVVEMNGGGIWQMVRRRTAHARVPEWNYLDLTRSGNTSTFDQLNDEGGSLIITGHELSTDGVARPGDWYRLAIAAYPLPVSFGLSDGWLATPGGGNTAMLTFAHDSGARVAVHGDDGLAIAATANAERIATDERFIEHLQTFVENLVTAQVESFQRSTDGPVTDTVIRFVVEDTNVVIHTSVPADSPDAQTNLDQMLGTLRYMNVNAATTPSG